MRPEYTQAVDAVRWGWSLWLVFLLPAGILWGATFWRPIAMRANRLAVGCGALLFAVGVFWFLVLWHGERIQWTKERNMETDAEQRDWTSDTWHQFAPITAIPAAVIYCVINLAVAQSIRVLCEWIGRRRAHASEPAALPMQRTEDGNPYRPSGPGS